ncbi:MAG: helix-turn-helix domain-containing protein [Patescibacteria group bacterium]
MAQEINLGGTIYISSKQAAEITGYAQDYVGQLARSGAIEAKRISGLWYIHEDSIRQHKEKTDAYVPQPPQPERVQEAEVSLSLDGKDYVSAKRASKLTGYSQDYVGQLARSGQVLSRQIGNRWYVDRTSLVEHKKKKDSLLATVQRDSVGLASASEEGENITEEAISESRDTHFTYINEDNQPIPQIPEKESSYPDTSLEGRSAPEETLESDVVNQIPIHVVWAPRQGRLGASSGPGGRSHANLSKRSILLAAGGSLLVGMLALVLYLGVSGVFTLPIHNLGLPRNEAAKGYLGNSIIVRRVGDSIHQLAEILFSKEVVYQRVP